MSIQLKIYCPKCQVVIMLKQGVHLTYITSLELPHCFPACEKCGYPESIMQAEIKEGHK